MLMQVSHLIVCIVDAAQSTHHVLVARAGTPPCAYNMSFFFFHCQRKENCASSGWYLCCLIIASPVLFRCVAVKQQSKGICSCGASSLRSHLPSSFASARFIFGSCVFCFVFQCASSLFIFFFNPNCCCCIRCGGVRVHKASNQAREQTRLEASKKERKGKKEDSAEKRWIEIGQRGKG
ncbi:hypothetical protein TbgDal_XI17970 [Trypanosoma brucei gambiense DAL972]|uniref:T. brucei spp.-specific protein n=1 Tax=Trypanosoma brucei gambiense (strain MHOM/CI/86/DAL972) TaxID=679716 RepID=D0AAH6_TRYB9|nr:hypothetical protein TbgDal_XI17970 [Trypanosoma brucei gambiense DAL972]CBH18677.1 hypothetical protein TbgDal_XI17970 [Trypanosoma brucei gambiense DAL972]|eukprot:XP_011780941.1 hypothetical protein TbgDal_XI17970 [Trypanosoma brucei gambiense DAL972]